MKFFEFFQMSLEKGLVSNKFNFAVFLDCFNSASVDEGKLTSERFPYLLTLVAKKFIPGEKKPINLLINQYLGDRTVAVEDRSSFFSQSREA